MTKGLLSLKHKTKLSNFSLAIYLTIFALVGGLVLLLTHATPNPNLPGDLNGDNKVDGADLSFLAANYKTTNAAADINNSGLVDVADLSILLSHYGQTYSGGGSTSSYDSAISYSAPANRPTHSCTRTVNVTSASQLTSAINNLQAGDCVVNTQTGGFSISGEVTIAKSLSSYAYIDLKTGSDAVRFTGGGTQTPSSDLPSVYIHNSSNIKIYGGNITNDRILVYNPSSNLTWWNFYAHDLAGDGLDIFPPFSGSNIDNIDFQGEISNWGINCQVLDPHAEKCTGIHGMNLADAGGGQVNNSRFAIYAHDGRSGAAIEQGSPSQPESGITIYLKANNLTMAAQSQVAGNGIQIWGAGAISNSTIPYIEVSNAQGRAIDTNGLYSGVSLSGYTVKYGRATNVILNPKLSRVIWDTRGGIVYQDISPKP